MLKVRRMQSLTVNSPLLHPPRVLQSSPQGVVFSSLAQSPSSLFFPFPSSRLCAAPFDSSHLCLLTCLLVDSGWAPLASLCLPSPSSQYSLQLCLFQLQSVFMLCIQQDPQHLARQLLCVSFLLPSVVLLFLGWAFFEPPTNSSHMSW